jgi:hypothetical protein
LGIFYNKVLKGAFRDKIPDLNRCWKKLGDDKLHDIYSSTNNIIVANHGG